MNLIYNNTMSRPNGESQFELFPGKLNLYQDMHEQSHTKSSLSLPLDKLF